MKPGVVTFECYRARDGWRWHAKRGGRLVAESGEAYTREHGARRALARMLEAIHTDRWLVKP